MVTRGSSRHLRQDRDVGLEIDDVTKSAFGVAEQGRDLHLRVIALERGDDLGGMKRPDGRNP
ncbi:hypothetical protein ACVWW1_001591 [Bradyrhizobium sp. JR3.5]